MSIPCLYLTTVPVLVRYLKGLDAILQAVEALPATTQDELLMARLSPGMLDFRHQVEIAIQFGLRTVMPIAGQVIPAFSLSPDVATLRAKLQTRLDLIGAIPSAAFMDETRVLSEQAGLATVRLPMPAFIHEFCLPNFLFHVSMAYAIARAGQVALGKGTYDGFHVYGD